MTKKIITIAVVLMTLFIGGAYAAATIGLDALVKDVPIGGDVTFTVTLDTDTTGDLLWSTQSPLTATMDGDSSGSISITSTGVSTHALKVAAGSGAVVGQKYKIKLIFLNSEQDIEAVATAGGVPVPELSTSILTATGLVGLLGMVMFRKRY